jgi:HTH-type transcriptional regulator / antitoxin MqsA
LSEDVRGDVRPMTLAYKGESITFDMPGWYCHSCSESIHTGADMNLSDRKLNLLKAPVEFSRLARDPVACPG